MRWRLERLAISHKHDFDWLSLRRAADGIVLARRPEGGWEAHIIECKRTVGDSAWQEIREQLRGSRIRLDAICGVVGITVDRVVLYTAYRRDKLGEASPDALLTKAAVGESGSAPAFVMGRIAWKNGRVELDGFGRFAHHRIPLDVRDGCGYATVSLSSAA